MKKNRFVSNMLVMYSLIIVLGLGASSWFIANTMAEQMIRTQTNYEAELMDKMKVDINGRLQSIGNIFTNLYLKEYDYQNITDVLREEQDDYQRELFINQFLRASSNGNQFVKEIILVDYQRNKTYLIAKSLFQDWNKEVDFLHSDFLKEVKKYENEIVMTPVYQSDYLKEQNDVISVYMNIVDIYNMQKSPKCGAVIINIDPKAFFEIYDSQGEQQIGTTYIVDPEGVIYYRTGDESLDYLLKQTKAPSREEQDQFVVKKADLVSWSRLSYIHIIDKSVLYREVYRLTLQQVLPVLVICLLLCLAAGVLIACLLGSRITRIVRHIRKIQKGRLDERLEVTRDDEIAVLENGLNDMSRKLEEYIDTIYVKDIKMKKAELRALQIQINPHFMFNTLESIRAMAISGDDPKTAQMLTILGNMFRWNLRHPDIVLIEDELQYVDYYMQLQELRFGERLEYEELLDLEQKELRVPKLTLQPIIENCMNHAFNQEMEVCRIRIHGKSEANGVCIFIEDNGIGMDAAALKLLQQKIETDSEEENLYHIGIKNVNERMKLLLGSSYGLRVSGSSLGGTCVALYLPAGRQEEEDVQSNDRG